MGQVYRVRHRELGTAFALKVLPLASSIQRARLLREGRLQARLQHRNVVRLIERFELDGDPAMILELVDGPGLDTWLEGRQLSMPEAETLFRQIVRGVGHAHEHGVLHRDLKPSNILLARTKEGWSPKIADFGISAARANEIDDESDEESLTGEGSGLGSPAYMAPEQAISARAVDRRADLFSLGCVLYELVCGRRAFPQQTPLAVLKAASQGDVVPSRELAPQAPERIHRAIERCLTPSREVRIGSCKELLAIMGTDDQDPTSADQEDTDVRAGPDETVLYGQRAGSHAPTVLYGQSAGSAIPPEPTRLLGSRLVLVVLGLVVAALLAAILILGSQSGESDGDGSYVPLEDVLGE
ncbi:MAG: serine/threonine protein kinase [Proteobacteria bacterium]|nr:serine/threonine protein kinase [Pseudomonadota bacterium]